jgi:hypothetical protein
VALNRRQALARSGSGLGALALGFLLGRDRALGAGDASGLPMDGLDPLVPKRPHFTPRAKRVISLFMQGGPSQMDTFDPKAELQKLDGKPLPDSFKSEDLKLQFMAAAGATLMGSPFAFQRHGQSGLEISDLFPNVARFADDLAVLSRIVHPRTRAKLVALGQSTLGSPQRRKLGRLGPGLRKRQPAGFHGHDRRRDSRQQQCL